MRTSQTVEAHLRNLFGPPSRSASFLWEKQEVAVHKWEAERTGEGVDLYVTDSGFASADSSHAVEFFSGLMPGRDEIAGHMASLHRYQHVHGVLLGHGHTVPTEPLWNQTALNSLLILRQAALVVPPLFAASHHVEFLQVVPTTALERESVHRMGVDAFLADWDDQQVAFWDSMRA
jgi:hypothetical protein